MWREREQTQSLNFFFLVFCCSSNVLVRWFRLHWCASGVRPLFGAHLTMGATIFVSLYIFVAGVQLSSLPRHVSQTTNFQTRVVPLLPSGVVGRNISVSSCSPLFLIIFDYRDWLAYNEYFRLTPQRSSGRSIDSLSAFSFYFASLSPYPEINLPFSL